MTLEALLKLPEGSENRSNFNRDFVAVILAKEELSSNKYVLDYNWLNPKTSDIPPATKYELTRIKQMDYLEAILRIMNYTIARGEIFSYEARLLKTVNLPYFAEISEKDFPPRLNPILAFRIILRQFTPTKINSPEYHLLWNEYNRPKKLKLEIKK